MPGGEKWKLYQHYRDMLAKEKLDAVFVETTTHARVLACDSRPPGRPRRLLREADDADDRRGPVPGHAVQKYDRVLQVGSQQRSMPINQYASKLVREGAIGKIQTVITFNFQPGWAGRPGQPEPIPSGLDWDQWCNQTELRPYHHDLQFGWGNYIDYDGGGQSWGVTGWGRTAWTRSSAPWEPTRTGPVEIWPEEGAVRPGDGPLRQRHPAQARGQEAQAWRTWGRSSSASTARSRSSAAASRPPRRTCSRGLLPRPSEGRGESVAHIQNFFDCMRTPQAAQRRRRDRPPRHHALPPGEHLPDHGAKALLGPVGEKFAGDDQANLLLSRPRRKGYELPKSADAVFDSDQRRVPNSRFQIPDSRMPDARCQMPDSPKTPSGIWSLPSGIPQAAHIARRFQG